MALQELTPIAVRTPWWYRSSKVWLLYVPQQRSWSCFGNIGWN